MKFPKLVVELNQYRHLIIFGVMLSHTKTFPYLSFSYHMNISEIRVNEMTNLPLSVFPPSYDLNTFKQILVMLLGHVISASSSYLSSSEQQFTGLFYI